MRLTLYTDLCLRLLMSLARSDIRAVVTDINLGSGSNGWQVARRARELRPEMPLLYVTGGNADEWARKRCSSEHPHQ